MLMHCLKDLPGNQEYYRTETEFRIGALLPREERRDAPMVAMTHDQSKVLRSGTIGSRLGAPGRWGGL
jgi:porphobilinogen deaminase